MYLIMLREQIIFACLYYKQQLMVVDHFLIPGSKYAIIYMI